MPSSLEIVLVSLTLEDSESFKASQPSCRDHQLMCFQGEAGTGNVVEAVRHCRSVLGAIRKLQSMDEDELYVFAKEIRAPVELVRQTKHLGRY